MSFDEKISTSNMLPGSLAKNDWLPYVLPSATKSAWARYFRCCRQCPKCKHDLSTNGRGSYRCPSCGYQEKPGKLQGRKRRKAA